MIWWICPGTACDFCWIWKVALSDHMCQIPVEWRIYLSSSLFIFLSDCTWMGALVLITLSSLGHFLFSGTCGQKTEPSKLDFKMWTPDEFPCYSLIVSSACCCLPSLALHLACKFFGHSIFLVLCVLHIFFVELQCDRLHCVCVAPGNRHKQMILWRNRSFGENEQFTLKEAFFNQHISKQEKEKKEW